MVIETERLILRKWEDTDAEWLYEYAKDPDIGNSAGWIPHKSVDDSRKIIKTVLSDFGCFAIVDKNSNHVIGSIDLMIGKDSNIEECANEEAEIGYWMAKPYQEKGLMKEAAIEILKYGFKDLKLKNIWLGYFDGNEKSKKLAESIGFIYKFTKKNIIWKITNEVRTEHILILSKQSFEEKYGV